MIKTRLIKAKSIENEEIIMTMTVRKIIITSYYEKSHNNDDNKNQNW